MSYSGRADVEDAFDSLWPCARVHYECVRVHDANTMTGSFRAFSSTSRARIRDRRPDGATRRVLFEVGFAQGLGRPIVLTAKDGTELPFDVKDMPTIFWDGQKKLKENMRRQDALIADKQGRWRQSGPVRRPGRNAINTG